MEKLKVGDIKKMKNSAGVCTMKLIEIIKEDIGNAYHSLGKFEKLRIEFYEDDWLSVYDQANQTKYIYFVEIPKWTNYEPLTYKFEILESEVPEADFVRLEAE